MTHGLFNAWVAKGYVEAESRGAGRAREFDFDEVIWIAALAALVRRGVAISQAKAMLDSVADRFRDALSDEFGRGKVLLVGSKVEVVRSNHAAWVVEHEIDPDPALIILSLHRLALATYRALLDALEAPKAPRGRPPKVVHGTATLSGEAQIYGSHSVVQRKNTA
jgi:DNA-binding transcriptional MerR regulator